MEFLEVWKRFQHGRSWLEVKCRLVEPKGKKLRCHEDNDQQK